MRTLTDQRLATFSHVKNIQISLGSSVCDLRLVVDVPTGAFDILPLWHFMGDVVGGKPRIQHANGVIAAGSHDDRHVES